MKKVDNKGFLLSEALIVSTFVLTVIALIFVQFKGVMVNFKKQYTYNNVENIYSLGALAEFFTKNNVAISGNNIMIFTGGASGSCTTNVNSTYKNMCTDIAKKIGADYIFYTDSDIETVKTTLNAGSSYNQELRDFAEKIKTDSVTGRKRLIAKFTNGSFSTVIIPDKVDSTCSEWEYGGTSECSAPCGGGTQTIYAYDKYDTSIKCESKHIKDVPCNVGACSTPTPCSTADDREFRDGTTCSKNCGGGTYNRLAYSKSTGQRCPTAEYDQSSGGSACNTQACVSDIYYLNAVYSSTKSIPKIGSSFDTTGLTPNSFPVDNSNIAAGIVAKAGRVSELYVCLKSIDSSNKFFITCFRGGTESDEFFTSNNNRMGELNSKLSSNNKFNCRSNDDSTTCNLTNKSIYFDKSGMVLISYTYGGSYTSGYYKVEECKIVSNVSDNNYCFNKNIYV